MIADSFESDPDVYISKTVTTPQSSADADWYCETEGSETCILHNGEFAVGDTLYIGVKCVQECSYKLRAWYIEVRDLSESSRTQMRFGAYTTHILKYYIAPDTAGLYTESIELKVEPEEQHSHIELYLSLDPNFKVVEEKPATHILKNGMAIKFGKNDFEWCVKCYVYVILNVRKESRYYLSS